MRHRRADHPVDRRPGGYGREAVLVPQARQLDLTRRHPVPRVRPARAEPPRQDAGRDAGRTHADDDAALRPSAAPERRERERVAQAAGGGGHLDHRGAGGAHCAVVVPDIVRNPIEVVRGDHDPVAAVPADQRLELGPPFDVDELRAGGERGAEQAETLTLRAGEAPSLPGRPAGDDDWRCAARQRAGDVRSIHVVEAQLNQVGTGDAVPIGAQLRRRGAGHGGAQQRRRPIPVDSWHVVA